ncbi:two component transcriptional regulator, winged helix family, partial [mine drainage metagenome]
PTTPPANDHPPYDHPATPPPYEHSPYEHSPYDPFESPPRVILLVKQEQLESLAETLAKLGTELEPKLSTDSYANLTTNLFDDFCLLPTTSFELSLRLARFVSYKGAKPPEVIEYGPLSLNLDTYQAMVNGEVLDLTYMEYELLRFLASKPGRVFTRDILLTQVWGYDYYGGARTV